MMNKFYAIIPARSGSKGLPHKNVLPWGETNILNHTAQQAVNSKMFSEVIVSSDSAEYLNAVFCDGVLLHKRRDELATDNAGIIDVILDIIDSRKINIKDSYVVLLQPTSPLRTSNHIKDSINVFISDCIDKNISLISVSDPINHSSTLKNIDKNVINMFSNTHTRRQDGHVEVAINGAIYISSVENIKSNNTMFTSEVKAFKMSILDSIDIDTKDEYLIAKLIFKYSDTKN